MRCGHGLVAWLVWGLVMAVSFVHAEVQLAYDDGTIGVLNCPAGAVQREACDTTSYRHTVLAYVIPSFFLAGVILFSALLYLIFKYGCNLCGGKVQSANYYVPASTLPALYSTADLVRPLCFTVICAVLCLSAMVWGVVGATQLRPALRELRASAAQSVADIMSDTAAVTRALSHANYYDATSRHFVESSLLDQFDMGAQYMTVTTATDTELRAMQNATVETIDKLGNRYIVAAYVLYTVSAAVSLLGVVVGFCNCRRYTSMGMWTLMTVLCILAWCCNAGLTQSHYVLRDACAEVRAYTAHRSNALAAVADCHVTTLGNAMRDSRTAILDRFARDTCTRVWASCVDRKRSALENARAGTVLDCPSDSIGSGSDVCAAASVAMLTQWLQSSFRTSDYILGDAAATEAAVTAGTTCALRTDRSTCGLSQCARECVTGRTSGERAGGGATLSTTGRAAMEYVTRVIVMQRVVHVMNTQGQSALTCDAVLRRVVPGLLPSCNDAVRNAATLRQSSGLLGLATFIGIFVYAWGAKRFISMSKALVPQYDKE